jgi:hypothetical protein
VIAALPQSLLLLFSDSPLGAGIAERKHRVVRSRRSIPILKEGSVALSRTICFIVLLAFCRTAWGVLAEMPGQNASGKNAASAPAKLQSMLEQPETAVWESFKNKDRMAFADLLAEEYTGVFADGQGEHDKQSAVDSVNQITIRRYSLSDFS